MRLFRAAKATQVQLLRVIGMAGITDKEVRALIAKAKREGRTATQADGYIPGLTLTASKAGTASWVVRYRTAGKQKEVSFPITLSDDGAGTLSAKTEFSVNRQDFAITYPGKADDLVRDEVVIKVDASMATTG